MVVLMIVLVGDIVLIVVLLVLMTLIIMVMEVMEVTVGDGVRVYDKVTIFT